MPLACHRVVVFHDGEASSGGDVCFENEVRNVDIFPALRFENNGLANLIRFPYPFKEVLPLLLFAHLSYC